MRLLPDTHLLIWAMGDPRRLGASLCDRLDYPAHTLLLLGHGGFQVEPPLLRRDLLDGGWQELSITARHVFVEVVATGS